MTHVTTFERWHIAHFSPGEAERAWFAEVGPAGVAAAIESDAAMTIIGDGAVLGFCGVHDYAGSVVLWSMWSAQARAKPLAMCRTLKRLLVAWRQEYARELVALDLGQEPQAKLARWLGMRERAPGEWVI